MLMENDDITIVSVYFYRTLYLRDDSVTDGFCRDDILKNASVILEDYYVAPPGIVF